MYEKGMSVRVSDQIMSLFKYVETELVEKSVFDTVIDDLVIDDLYKKFAQAAHEKHILAYMDSTKFGEATLAASLPVAVQNVNIGVEYVNITESLLFWIKTNDTRILLTV